MSSQLPTQEAGTVFDNKENTSVDPTAGCRCLPLGCLVLHIDFPSCSQVVASDVWSGSSTQPIHKTQQ